MSTTNVTSARVALVVLAALILGIVGVAWSGIFPSQCNEIRKLEGDEQTLAKLRLKLTDFINSREGRIALVEIPGRSQRNQKLPIGFDAVVSELKINKTYLQLVKEVDRSSDLLEQPASITAVGIGYSRSRILFPVAKSTTKLGRFDPMTLVGPPVIRCERS